MERAKSFFPLRNAYYYGRRLNHELRDRLGKQLIQDSETTALMAQTVYNSGDGDYIEIGSLHGGSAITAALVKKEFYLEGSIFCVEPKPRNLLDNAKLFGVEDRIQLIKSYSYQVNLSNLKFTCGFIDGDHRSPHPWDDWIYLKGVVSRYIMFDDYDKSEVGVQEAVRLAMCDFDWTTVHIAGSLVILNKYDFNGLQE